MESRPAESDLERYKLEIDLQRFEVERSSDKEIELERMALERDTEIARVDSDIRNKFREDARHRSDQAFILARMGLILGAAITLIIALAALWIIAFSTSDAAKYAAGLVAAVDLAAIAATFVYGSRGIVSKTEKKDPPPELQ